MQSRSTIELIENQPQYFSTTELSWANGVALYAVAGVDVEFPSPATGGTFRVCVSNVVGQVLVGDGLLVRIEPKVPIANIFAMLEVAYDLKLRVGDGLVDVESLPELVERLASILAMRVIDRAMRGLHRDYIENSERLGVVRGRLNTLETVRLLAQGSPFVRCRHQEHTVDIEDNQLLLWALTVAARLGLSRPSVIEEVRKARQALAGLVSITEHSADRCVGRTYNRLNQDYRSSHAICRFILESVGPGARCGNYDVVPVLVNMPALFELFVAEWLRRRLPRALQVEAQHRVFLDEAATLCFRIDLVLREEQLGSARAVMDTKYKREARPSEEDIQQVVAYAVKLRVDTAFLVYPSVTTDHISDSWRYSSPEPVVRSRRAD